MTDQDVTGQQPDPRLVAKYVISYLHGHQDLIKYQLDSSTELLNVRNSMLGLEWDEKAEKYIQVHEPMINERGADAIMTFLVPRVTKIVSLSNVDAQDVQNRCHKYMDSTTYLLLRHMTEWEISNIQIMDNIIEMVDDLFFATMNKAKGAGERDTLRKQYTHVESSENISDSRQQKPVMTMPFNARR